ncbi:MAG: hypothetical protein ACMXYK_04550 [Candidatus Woesearchaeota archaeon]
MGKKLSITAFIFGLVSIVFSPLSIVSLFLGIIDLVRKDDDSIRWMSIVAVVLGIIFGLFLFIGMLAYSGILDPASLIPPQ